MEIEFYKTSGVSLLDVWYPDSINCHPSYYESDSTFYIGPFAQHAVIGALFIDNDNVRVAIGFANWAVVGADEYWQVPMPTWTPKSTYILTVDKGINGGVFRLWKLKVTPSNGAIYSFLEELQYLGTHPDLAVLDSNGNPIAFIPLRPIPAAIIAAAILGGAIIGAGYFWQKGKYWEYKKSENEIVEVQNLQQAIESYFNGLNRLIDKVSNCDSAANPDLCFRIAETAAKAGGEIVASAAAAPDIKGADHDENDIGIKDILVKLKDVAGYVVGFSALILLLFKFNIIKYIMDMIREGFRR